MGVDLVLLLSNLSGICGGHSEAHKVTSGPLLVRASKTGPVWTEALARRLLAAARGVPKHASNYLGHTSDLMCKTDAAAWNHWRLPAQVSWMPSIAAR